MLEANLKSSVFRLVCTRTGDVMNLNLPTNLQDLRESERSDYKF